MKQHSLAVTRAQDNIGEVFSRGKNMPIPRSHNHSYSSSMATEGTKYQLMATSHSDIHSRSYVASTPNGAKYQWSRLMFGRRVIPEEKLPVPLKATSVIMSDHLIRSELHSNGSDSPQAQNPLSTDNNEGEKDVPDGDATISWDS